MKFKAGLSRRRMRYATLLFQKNDGISMRGVSELVKKKFGMGMAGAILTMCKKTADAELSAKAETKAKSRIKSEPKQERRDKWRDAWKEGMRAKHVAKSNGSVVEKFEKERKASTWKTDDKAFKVEIDWKVAKPKANGKPVGKAFGMPPEFYQGLKLVRSALGSKQAGTVTLINYDDRMEVKYELEEKIEKHGKFDLNI